MEKINVAEILRKCPSGMELDSPAYNNLYFNTIIDSDYYPIKCYTSDNEMLNTVYLTKYGEIRREENAKCVIFPKGKTTWEGFVPFCQFKAGDVIVSENGNIVLFSHVDTKNVVHYHCIIPTYGSFRIEENTSIGVGRYYDCVLANEQQRQRMYDKIKCSGHKYNQSVNKLEKLIKPKFKVGDRIKHKVTGNIYTVIFIRSNEYDVRVTNEIGESISIEAQDIYELVPNKFDISTLEPFESRVLVRNCDWDEWRPAFWGYLTNNTHGFNYDTTRGYYKQCIPYEGNEYLLGKTDDCDEYYKTWE